MSRRWVVVATAFVLAACSAEDSGGGGVCMPGAVDTCPCFDGSQGFRACNAAGTGYLQCSCGDSAAAAGPNGVGQLPAQPVTGQEPVQPQPTDTGAAGAAAPVPTDTGMAGGVAPPPQDPGGDPAAPPPATDPVAPMDPMDPVEPMDPTEPDPVVVEGDEVPATAYCAEAADWDPAWAEWEVEVLRLTNEVRASGADCGTYGSFGPAEPLTMVAELRCSARLHSMDMGVQNYFAHDALDGRDPFDRMRDAGYSAGTMGENIAKGQTSPQQVVDGWVDSDGHCRNIMDPNFTDIGVGYWEGEADNQFFNGNRLWTQNFGGGGGGAGACPWGPPWC